MAAGWGGSRTGRPCHNSGVPPHAQTAFVAYTNIRTLNDTLGESVRPAQGFSDNVTVHAGQNVKKVHQKRPKVKSLVGLEPC